jgi:hypothetical protein
MSRGLAGGGGLPPGSFWAKVRLKKDLEVDLWKSIGIFFGLKAKPAGCSG